jgi:hypothetical protein
MALKRIRQHTALRQRRVSVWLDSVSQSDAPGIRFEEQHKDLKT